MRLSLGFFISVVFLFGLNTESNAASLDFSEITTDPSSQSTLNLSNATLTHYDNSKGFYYIPDYSGTTDSTNGKGSICAHNGTQCLGSMTIDFLNDIQSLSIGFNGGETGDEVYVSGWKDGILTDFTNITSNGITDFSFLGIVDQIVLFNDSQAGGFLYQDFTFEMLTSNGEVIATPLPAALPMFGAALGLLGLQRLRQKKSKLNG